MQSFLQKTVTKLQKIFVREIEQVRLRRLQWDALTKRVEGVYKEAEVEIAKEQFYTKLFLHNNSSDRKEFEGKVYNNWNSIQISTAHLPTGVGAKEFSEGRPVRQSRVVEGGSALVFSQTMGGQVVVSLYPTRSDLSGENKPIVLKIFKDPCAISKEYIWKSLVRFLKYSHFTSHFSQIPFGLYARQVVYERRWDLIVMIFGAVISALIGVYLSHAFSSPPPMPGA